MTTKAKQAVSVVWGALIVLVVVLLVAGIIWSAIGPDDNTDADREFDDCYRNALDAGADADFATHMCRP